MLAKFEEAATIQEVETLTNEMASHLKFKHTEARSFNRALWRMIQTFAKGDIVKIFGIDEDYLQIRVFDYLNDDDEVRFCINLLFLPNIQFINENTDEEILTILYEMLKAKNLHLLCNDLIVNSLQKVDGVLT